MITSAEEFVALRTSENPDEYWRAAHEEAPLEVWRDVLRDYPDMEFWVIHNKTVPLCLLEEFARSDDADVRWKVATKRKLSRELFLLLSQDTDESVRNRIAINAKTPRDILESLTNDPSAGVAKTARERLGLRDARAMLRAATAHSESG